MKLILRGALLAASIASIGAAYGGDRDEPAANTQFAELPNAIAQDTVYSDPGLDPTQSGWRWAQFVARQHSGSVFQRAAS